MKASSLATLLLLFATTTLRATTLRVEPILLELEAPTAAATLTLRNDDDIEVAAQTRVFRWVQHDGKENLVLTT